MDRIDSDFMAGHDFACCFEKVTLFTDNIVTDRVRLKRCRLQTVSGSDWRSMQKSLGGDCKGDQLLDFFCSKVFAGSNRKHDRIYVKQENVRSTERETHTN